MINRRAILVGTGAVLLVSGCGDSGPGVLTVTATGTSGMNTGPDGSDRPLSISVLQLSGTAAFDAADVFALQNPEAALGSELVKSDQIVLAPGATATKAIPLSAATSAIGFVAGFRDPSGKTFRSRVAAPAKGSAAVTVNVGAGGMIVSGL